jgi:hypothetical protein
MARKKSGAEIPGTCCSFRVSSVRWDSWEYLLQTAGSNQDDLVGYVIEKSPLAKYLREGLSAVRFPKRKRLETDVDEEEDEDQD